MIYLEYKNLDDAIHRIVPDLLFKSGESDMYKIQGFHKNFRDLFIHCKSIKCNIDIGDFYYTQRKWSHLITCYVEPGSIDEFSKQLSKSSNFSSNFYFKKKNARLGSGNGNCLTTMVAIRETRGSKFDTLSFTYRTTILTRQFACDLVLFNKIAEYLNRTNPKCNITNINAFIPVAGLDYTHLILFKDGLRFDVNKHPNDDFCSKSIWYNEDFILGNKSTKFQTRDRLAKKYRAGKAESVGIEELNFEG